MGGTLFSETVTFIAINVIANINVKTLKSTEESNTTNVA